MVSDGKILVPPEITSGRSSEVYPQMHSTEHTAHKPCASCLLGHELLHPAVTEAPPRLSASTNPQHPHYAQRSLAPSTFAESKSESANGLTPGPASSDAVRDTHRSDTNIICDRLVLRAGRRRWLASPSRPALRPRGRPRSPAQPNVMSRRSDAASKRPTSRPTAGQPDGKRTSLKALELSFSGLCTVLYTNVYSCTQMCTVAARAKNKDRLQVFFHPKPLRNQMEELFCLQNFIYRRQNVLHVTFCISQVVKTLCT